MSKSSTIKKIICVVLCIALCIGMLYYLTFLTERKNSYEKYKPFFDEKNDFDVLFVGTSHILNSIYPMELWNDYGIVSYNFGGHANQVPTSYWVLKNALDYTSPKLVVMDCQSISSELKYNENWYFLHLSFDAFPLTLTKLKAVNDLLDTEGVDIPQLGLERPTASSLIWDFSVYHSRWAELTDDDFSPSINVEKGAESRIGVSVPNSISEIDEKFEGNSIGIRYLERIINECKAKGIEVLLVNPPLPATDEQRMDANRVYDIAEENNVNYINFLDMDIVNYETDMYDPDSHLNPSGARKVTDYIGKYINDNYDIPDRRLEESYNSWYDDYDIYSSFKFDNLKSEENLDSYLTLLYGEDFDISVILGNKSLVTDDYYSKFFDNIGIDLKSVELADISEDIKIIVSDNVSGNVIDSASFANGNRVIL